ncbi:OsmC family protein [Kutzneria viridogrisea]
MVWTGNTGSGTASPRGYERAHEVRVPGKPVLLGSSDPAFRGDPGRHNPEDLLVASLSQCHMLWFLGLAAAEGVVVTAYTDRAVGTMVEQADGSGRFTEVVLHPEVVSDANAEQLARLHETAHNKCFIANSVNFPVRLG